MSRALHGARSTVPLLVLTCACGGQSAPSVSSSTHWLACEVDADCANLARGAVCGADGFCSTDDGTRLEQQLIYSDEFDEAALEDTRFGYETGTGIRNGEAQAYTDRSENVSLEAGNLILTARAEERDGAMFTSGSVTSEGAFSFTFGRIEARFAAPVGRGCSAAFWMLPEGPAPAVPSCIDGSGCYSGTWPAWGDMTVANLQSQLAGQVLGTASYGIWDDDRGGVRHGVFSGDNALVQDPTTYHTYALEWGPERLVWFVDDVEVRTLELPPEDMYLPNGDDPFQQPFHLRMNLAIGGLDQAPNAADYPQELRIDWIRVWQWKPAG
ncbi:MAG TPA: glycoside hydrolase family 16 protein [Polyangiaceae bacterium]|nr:glycoside hydrolase family 16 protein [Polyangiaceae bacterium]